MLQTLAPFRLHLWKILQCVRYQGDESQGRAYVQKKKEKNQLAPHSKVRSQLKPCPPQWAETRTWLRLEAQF